MSSLFSKGVFTALFVAVFPSLSQLGTLAEVTKPYQGEYTLTVFEIGGKNRLNDGEECRLTLLPDGKLTLVWQSEHRPQVSVFGSYTFLSESTCQVTLQYSFYKIEKQATYENGALLYTDVLDGKPIFMQFSR